jgi:stage II sporulation protein D
MMRMLPGLSLALAAALLPLPASGGGTQAGGAPVAATPAEALDAFYRGDVAACIRDYRAVLDRDPDDAAARLDLAGVLRGEGLAEEAMVHLDILLQAQPASAPVRLAAAETAIYARQPGRALRYLEPLAPSARSLYLSGLALMDEGLDDQALAAFSASLERERFHPMAWFWCATLRYELNDLDGAESAYREALAQEPNLTASYLPLARISMARGLTEQAYRLLQRAAASRPDDRDIREQVAALERENPALVARAAAAQTARRAAVVARRAEVLSAGRDQQPVVRVGLVEGAHELHLKAGGAYGLFWSQGPGRGPTRLAAGDAAASLTARLVDGMVEVTDGSALVRSASPVSLVYDDPAATTVVFDVAYGRGSFWAGSEDRMYRGTIEILPKPAGLTLVDALPIEEYLYSVVPSEMPSTWPAAALQAQAVAARSYTMANMGRYAKRGFDLLGNVWSAAYGGLLNETPTVRAAVDATRGEALMDGEKPLSAFYSANSGGHTETTEAVWGFASPLPAVADPLLDASAFPLGPQALSQWLRDRPDTYSSRPRYSSRSAYRWETWVPRSEIEARIAGGAPLGSVVAVRAEARGASGRVSQVRIQGTAGTRTVRGDAIRWALGGLRSNLFVVEPKLGEDGLPQYFVFTGAGWGHGVGLCQSGAAGMAADGIGAVSILRHYYGAVELRNLY